MGNCQAIDAAALVIQHPDGRIERLYWSVSANEVMRANPGHYVSLIIPLSTQEEDKNQQKTVRFTRVKLLRSHDTLVLGHAYKLIIECFVLLFWSCRGCEGVARKEVREDEEASAGTSSTDGDGSGKSEHRLRARRETRLWEDQNHGARPYRASQKLRVEGVSICNIQNSL